MLKAACVLAVKMSMIDKRQATFVSPELQACLWPEGLPAEDVRADPPSEFRLAFIDPAGSVYSQSPAAFEMDLGHLRP